MVDPVGNVGPNTAFIQNNDIRLGTEKDTGSAYLSGARFAKDDSPGAKFLGFCERALNLTWPLARPLVKAIGNLLVPGLAIYHFAKHIGSLIDVAKRQDLFPNFQTAQSLKESNPEQLRALAKDAKLCSCNSTARGRPSFSSEGYRLAPNTAFIGGIDKANPEQQRTEAKVLFEQFPDTLKTNMSSHEGSFIDKKTGLVASFVLDKSDPSSKPKIHVIFAGTGCGTAQEPEIENRHIGSDISAGGIITSHVPPSFKQASALVKLMQDQFGSGYEVEVKGFSMGGGLAMFAGIDNNAKTVALCPAPMSPACQRDLGDDKIRTAIDQEKVTNLSTKNCWVSDHTKLAKLGRAWEQLSGNTIPHLVGPGYRLQQTPPGVQENINEGGWFHFFDYHNFSSASWNEFAKSA